MTQHELANLVGAMFDTITDALCMNSWTCSEAEAVWEVMQAVNRTQLGATFMTCHAQTDDDDTDQHKVVTDDRNGRAIGWTHK